MAAELSSGKSQRFALDRCSFEKLLAAAWVLQCLHDHLHNVQIGRDEAIAEPAKIQHPVDTGNSSLQTYMKPTVQPSSRATGDGSALDQPDRRLVDDEIPVEPVAAQQLTGTETLIFDSAVKDEPGTPELKKILHSEDVSTVRASKPPIPVLKRAVDDYKERAWHRSAFKRRTPDFLRTALGRTLETFTNLRPALRVNVTLRALRAVAIATPVLLLAVIAALLLLETWRREPFHSAQAISIPSTPAQGRVVSDTSKTLTTTTRGLSENAKRTGKEPWRPRPVPQLEVSHKHVTDPATWSVVQRLSRYEIRGLRRQAKYGDDSAAFTLGMAYEVGHFVPQNCAEAARWVAMAAEAGDASAQYNLGLRYQDGDGVSTNKTESEKWLRKAAAHKNRQAKLALRMLASR